MSKKNINTIEYWDKRFESINGKTDWELCNGNKQSKNFMQSMINNLPTKNLNELKTANILDFGCALGDGANYLYQRFKKATVTGYDFSKNAINICLKKYPDIYFISDFHEEKYDYIILNNVLQCVDEPHKFVEDLLKYTKKCMVIMVPFGSYGTTIEHYNSFQFKSFPKEIGKFYCRKMKTIDTENWAYKQILVRYERIE